MSDSTGLRRSKAADDMEITLTHRRYESFLEKNASATSVLDMLCRLVFSTDEIATIPVNQVLVHIIQGFTIRCLNGT